MTHSNENLHVYSREIKNDERTSLSILASLVTPGATVLDLGTGSGALGQFLHEQAQCTVDGLTFNSAEADVARPYYRRIEVANLETCVLQDIFPDTRYDFIVCADVLEHLSRPERIVQACRDLLTPGGKLLISVPNAGYSGLIGELIQGDFIYREEGLLDRTHLRFFTRRSLTRFLSELDWSLKTMDTVVRELPGSEFHVAFDSLPPAMSRHLLAIPDALTYQFIAVAQPRVAGDTAPTDAVATQGGQALFSTQLYLGINGEYAENTKLVTAGTIGKARQTLQFTLPATELTSLRLDPADRPGFMHLYRFTLRDAQGVPVWQWNSDTDGLAQLEDAPHQQIFLRPLWPAALVLLQGDDPWLQLPIPQDIVMACTRNGGATLEAELGWPMSADYLALSETVNPLTARLSEMENHTEQERHARLHVAAELQATANHNKYLIEQSLERSDHNKHLVEQNLDKTSSLQVALAALAEQNRVVLDQNRTLYAEELARKGTELQAMVERNQSLQEDKHALNAEKQQLQERQQALQKDIEGLAAHLQWIENSTIFRATRPLVNFKMWLTGASRDSKASIATLAPTPTPEPAPINPGHPVDIIVPVYRGLEDTRCCIESVLAYAHTYQTPFRLIAINDASPDPEVTEWLREKAAQDTRLMLLENQENLGFVGTVNRGMALSSTNDVILLNSDAEVANDWLDRMVSAAWAAPRIASVTPFSNNATICSYPRFCEDNALPGGYDTATLDKLFASTNSGQAVDVPTGVGFCMYIRRDCLAEVGLFDVESFGKGYGEENDFCQRAAKAEWRNLHLLDTFVRHAGGVSFGAAKSPREQEAMNILRRLHPDYEREVHQFVAIDPARSARQMVDLARIRESGVPVVLAVMHDRAGGTARHVTELASHLDSHAVFFTLTPSTGGKVILQQLGNETPWELSFHLENEFDSLIMALRHIGVRHIHYHHLIGHGLRILDLPTQLGVLYDFTAHDFYTLCPQISLTDSTNSYCGEKGVDQCRSCLRVSPAPGGMDIETWRSTYGEFVAKARYVLAPSRDAAQRFAKFLPAANIRYAPHTDMPQASELPSPAPARLANHAPLKIVVVGALSPIKGADVLEDVAAEAARNGAPLEFHLIGYAYRDLRTQPSQYLKVHGQYAENDLPDLFAAIQPNVAWFPAQWPETYSYTLSACLQAGLPIVAPDLGAFPERLRARSWSWVKPWNTKAADWLAFFLDLRKNHFITGHAPGAQIGTAEPLGATALGWSYEMDYLTDMAVAAPYTTPLSMNELVTRNNVRGADMQPWRQRTKHQLLLGLVRLRTSPGLRSVARAIPLRWQTRVKNWLRA